MTPLLPLRLNAADDGGDPLAGKEAGEEGAEFVHCAGDDEGFALEGGAVADAGDGLGVHDDVAAFEEFGVLHFGEFLEAGFCWAGAEGGDGDAAAFEFVGDGVGEGEDVGFAGVVDGHQGAGLKGGGGGDVEDAAGALGDHGGEEEFGQRGEGVDVEVEHVEFFLEVGFEEKAEVAVACIVDEDVHMDAGRLEFVVDFLRGLGQGEVFDEDAGVGVVFGFQLGGEVLEGLFAAGDEDEVEAVGGEQFGEFEADAAGCAGDEGGLGCGHGGYLPYEMGI